MKRTLLVVAAGAITAALIPAQLSTAKASGSAIDVVVCWQTRPCSSKTSPQLLLKFLPTAANLTASEGKEAEPNAAPVH
jgi:hypothetical protein